MKKIKLLIKFSVAMFTIIAITYPIAAFSDIPFVKKYRDLYIETAMTTNSHQWLATAFLPEYIVNDVVERNKKDQESMQNFTVSWENVSYASTFEEPVVEEKPDYEALFFEKYWELDTEDFRNFLKENPDLLENGYDKLFINNSKHEYDIKSVFDERIYLLDAENNTIIFEVTGSGFVGKLATIKDPSQVRLAKSKTLGSYGTILRDFYNDEEPVLAINCSGFKDVEDKGNGGVVVGSLIIDGVEYGNPKSKYFLFGQKFDDKFYIEKYDESLTKDYRWAAQFLPALIINGEKKVEGSFGFGIQPRTAIGQSTKGEMLLLIIDGRQVGYSIGATVSDEADIMLKHDAYQAVNADGGSSSLMWYDGKNITKPSSKNNLGRYLPDALVVDKAVKE